VIVHNKGIQKFLLLTESFVDIHSESKFRFDPYFSDERIERARNVWSDHLEGGKVDPEMVPFIDRLWKVPWVMPFSSCCGHAGDKQAHIAFKIKISYEEFLELMYLFVVFYNRVVSELGNLGKKSRTGSPVKLSFSAGGISFYIAFHTSTWKEEAEILVGLLEEHVPSSRELYLPANV